MFKRVYMILSASSGWLIFNPDPVLISIKFKELKPALNKRVMNIMYNVEHSLIKNFIKVAY